MAVLNFTLSSLEEGAMCAAKVETHAITSLGPLFKITEVSLWDNVDAVLNMSEDSIHHDSVQKTSSSCVTTDASSNSKHTINYFTSVEDMELAQQMDALGLPISFSTTREKRNVTTSGRKKATRFESVSADKNVNNRVSQDSINQPTCCNASEDQSESSHYGFEGKHNRGHIHSLAESTTVIATVSSERDKEQNPHELSSFSMSTCADKEIIPEGIDLEGNTKIPDHLTSSTADDYTENVDESSSGFCEEREYLEGSSDSCHITGAKDDVVAINISQPCDSSIESSSTYSLIDKHIYDYPDSSTCCELGDWRVIWDTYYMRNYFYNCKTLESTWYPPPGLEHLPFSLSKSSSQVFPDEVGENPDVGVARETIQDQDAYMLQDRANLFQEKGCNGILFTDESSEEISSNMNHNAGISMSISNGLSLDCVFDGFDKHAEAKDSNTFMGYATDEPGSNDYLGKQDENVSDVSLDVPINARSGLPEKYMTSSVDKLVSHHETALSEKKKRVRRVRSQPMPGVIGDLSVNILKYWCQRYLLFSRFDNGIKMDEEGWFSVTPEPIARHHASRCGAGTVIDCFAGVGGNAIQFALRSNHVIAIDIDPLKIEYAQHNAAIYGVDNKIDFVKGDFFKMAAHLKGDTVYMSPPWGGPDYAKVQTYDITSMLKPHDGHYIFKIARMIAPTVVMFLPRNVDVNQLAELALSVNPPWELEVEKSFLNGKLKAVTAYFSNNTQLKEEIQAKLN